MSLLINILSDYQKNSLENVKLLAALKLFDTNTDVLCNKANFKTCGVIEPAMYLMLTEKEYPENTIHVIDTKIAGNLPEKYVLACSNKQWYIAPDNGLLSILMENKPCAFFEIPTKPGQFVDFTKHVLIPALWNVTDARFKTENIQLPPARTIVDSRLGEPGFQNNIYRLSIIYFDENGDTYYNLHRNYFDENIAGNAFDIRLSITQSISKISEHYSQVPEGEVAALFHPSGYLYLKNHHGNARKLLGLRQDSKLMLQVKK